MEPSSLGFFMKNKAVKTGISLGIFSTLGLAAYYYLKDGQILASKTYSDDSLVEVTHLIHRDYFPVYLKISKQAEKLNSKLATSG